MLEWQDDKLASYTCTGESGDENRILYTYDAEGNLASKTIQEKQNVGNTYKNSERYNYTWAYGKLINQLYTKYEADGITENQQIVVKFVYDSFNCVQGFLVDDSGEYLYLKNLKGDIVGVVDENGNVVAEYQYGSWGTPTITISESAEASVSSVIELLPLAYRGCCYDSVAKLYFTEKRFYNPEWGRFLNALDTESSELPSATDYSLYTFWENHPFWYTDGAEKEAYIANREANYKHNEDITNKYPIVANDYIYAQHTQAIKRYRFGINQGNQMGCGWIATHNSLKVLGASMSPEEIIRAYEEYGIFLQGVFGINPLAIARFFTENGYEVKISFDDFEDTAKDYEVNIMYYKKPPTDHYVAIVYDSTNDSFWGYNTFGESDDNGNVVTNADNLESSISVLTKTVNVGMPNQRTDTYTGKILISISPKNK